MIHIKLKSFLQKESTIYIDIVVHLKFVIFTLSLFNLRARKNNNNVSNVCIKHIYHAIIILFRIQ